MSEPEVWLRGSIPGIAAHLQPVAHSLLQSREEVQRVIEGMTPEHLWHAHPNAASIGFHVLHAIGSLDRLFTYARGAALSDAQREILRQELQPEINLTANDLLAAFHTAVERALDQLRHTDETTLTSKR